MAGCEQIPVSESQMSWVQALPSSIVIADYLLFAVLLFPWAEKRFELMDRELKGGDYHRLSKAIRAELDDVFSRRLNLKRMSKDAITTVFVNMPAFVKHQRNNSWPAWLRKKSYFTDCSRFHAICMEARGGEAVDVSLFVNVSSDSRAPLRERAAQSGTGRRGGRRGTNPAFTLDKKGVFGLKKG